MFDFEDPDAEPADNATDGGAPADPPDPAPEDGAAAAPADGPQAAKPEDFAATLREAFAGDLDEEELDALKKGLKAEDLRAYPPSVRAGIRAILRETTTATERYETQRAAREQETATRLAKLESDERALRKREAAFMAVAASKAALHPGELPADVDPFTKEGQLAVIRHEVQKLHATAADPVREEARKLAETRFWDDLCETYPDLKDQKVADEFGAMVADLNKGVDLAKGERPAVPAGVAAELFFARRQRETARAEADARKAREAEDRAVGARAISRATVGGSQDLVARYNALRKQDEDAAHDLLMSNPQMRAAVLGSAGLSH